MLALGKALAKQFTTGILAPAESEYAFVPNTAFDDSFTISSNHGS